MDINWNRFGIMFAALTSVTSITSGLGESLCWSRLHIPCDARLAASSYPHRTWAVHANISFGKQPYRWLLGEARVNLSASAISFTFNMGQVFAQQTRHSCRVWANLFCTTLYLCVLSHFCSRSKNISDFWLVGPRAGVHQLFDLVAGTSTGGAFWHCTPTTATA